MAACTASSRKAAFVSPEAGCTVFFEAAGYGDETRKAAGPARVHGGHRGRRLPDPRRSVFGGSVDSR